MSSQIAVVDAIRKQKQQWWEKRAATFLCRAKFYILSQLWRNMNAFKTFPLSMRLYAIIKREKNLITARKTVTKNPSIRIKGPLWEEKRHRSQTFAHNNAINIRFPIEHTHARKVEHRVSLSSGKIFRDKSIGDKPIKKNGKSWRRTIAIVPAGKIHGNFPTFEGP